MTKNAEREHKVKETLLYPYLWKGSFLIENIQHINSVQVDGLYKREKL